MSSFPTPRGWSRTTRLAVAVVVVAVVVLVATVIVVRRTSDRRPSTLPDAAAAFGGDATLARSVLSGAFSPSGRLVLVETTAGIGIATGEEERVDEDRDVRFLTPPGSRAVDAAWFPSETAVLMVEGPVPTGQLAVIELSGTVRGSIPLQSPFSVGSGHGMAVAPSGRHAVLTAEERDPVGGERHFHLMLVDLERGEVSTLTPPDGPDETRPVFLTEDEVAFTETSRPAGAARVMTLEVGTGTPRPISPDGTEARLVGAVGGAAAFVAGDAVWVAGDEPRQLAEVDADVIAVHPDGRLLLLGYRGRAELRRI